MCMAVGSGADWRDRVRIWDLPTRVFHWSLAALVTIALITGFIGGNLMAWHGRAGIAITGLLVFRVVWGLAGSTYARFSQFVRGPASVSTYLRGHWQGLGHNPLGAISVLAMLAVLAAQVATGLPGNDDIAFNGPLYDVVSKDFSNTMTSLHRLNAWLVAALVALHLGAIAFYVRIRKEDVLRPMLRGWKERKNGSEDSLSGGGFIAFVVALGLALAAAWGATGAWIPAPPAPPASQTAPDF